ncbi:MAG: carboxy terminal-processing peptidase [Akkermansiaceae bacterium]|jgi:carboxyl-terminal processing protease|nr:carboxy terminal-processing peptidase [Luteolibacter sp.]
MIKILLRNATLVVGFIASSQALKAQQADFDEVGKQMAIMLQNSHYAGIRFDAQLSRRFFEDYLKSLDFQKVYFTQQDVDAFEANYAERLHTLLLQGKSMQPAVEIYNVFRQRVEERTKQAEELLAGNFDFSGDETVMMSRKDATWPKNEAEAKKIWAQEIKEAVLAETLRQETLSNLAKEQGKDDPNADNLDPKKKVSLRYKRLLTSIQDVDHDDIANYFLSAVAASFDPHTDYMSFREMNRFNDGMQNELVGIGALLQAEEDGATVIKGIVVGGPADKEGSLKLNDRVVGVDSINTGKPADMTDIMFMSIDKVVDLIRGKEGTTVALKVEPAGGAAGETKIIKIKRDKVELKDEHASGELIEMKNAAGESKKIGVITLPEFYGDIDVGDASASDDVKLILTRLIEEKMDGLIFDLRNNGGGSLKGACRITGLFIDSDSVVQVKNQIGQVLVKDSYDTKPLYTGPMVVLIDKSSASASEIFAGALQDYNRAVIVGESSTFGKGTVQTMVHVGPQLPLFAAKDKAGSIKVTIQKFYRPSGSSTQMEGVVPNIVMPSIMDALEVGEAHMDNALPHDRIRPAADFRPEDKRSLFIPRLKELSQERISKCQDFNYSIQDILKTKERIKKNQISLNLAERKRELAESEEQRKQRNTERRERFEKIAKEDAKNFKFYKVNLDIIDAAAPLKAYDPAAENKDFMRRAKDENESLDDTPDWPTGLNPEKREAIHVLADLIHLTDNAKMAGILKNDGEIR